MASRLKDATETTPRTAEEIASPRHDDMHIAGFAELVSAVEMAGTDSEEAVASRQEVDEMEMDASAALADGMGADDERTNALLAEPRDTRDAELRDDMDGEDKSDDEEEPPRRTIR